MKISIRKGRFFLDFELKSIEISCSEIDESYKKPLYEVGGVEYKYTLDSKGDLTSLLKGVISDDFPDDLSIQYFSEPKEGALNWIHYITFSKKNGQLHFENWFCLGWQNWKEDVHVNRFGPLFVEQFKENKFGNASFELADERNDGVGYMTVNQSVLKGLLLGDVINRCNQRISKTISDTLKSIQEHWFSESFDFPDEYKHIFAKYLTFFGQFLEDIGIKGQVSVATLDKGVVLTFDPKDKNEAIENIQMALSTYLALPNNVDVIKPNQDAMSQVKYQQLLATIDHLQGSLRLANALVDIKELENKILKDKQINSATISQALTISNTDKKWEVVEGVTVSKYKGKFFEIDIPKLVKRLGLNRK